MRVAGARIKNGKLTLNGKSFNIACDTGSRSERKLNIVGGCGVRREDYRTAEFATSR